ncbi:DnaB-like helicase N-terminal domain-containing protein [Streptomyces rimosus]|uniref:DnaB-like helicase N-terminal domain-containing protein n=1 Tax=Streptomyces rimosus TaxID=1927 RepID=UPI00373AF20D
MTPHREARGPRPHRTYRSHARPDPNHPRSRAARLRGQPRCRHHGPWLPHRLRRHRAHPSRPSRAAQCLHHGGLIHAQPAPQRRPGRLRKGHYRPAHETIHQSILDLHVQGKAVDPTAFGHRLDQAGILTKFGGKSCLHSLV